MSKELVVINEENLKALRQNNLMLDSLEEIIEEPCSTRHMMAAASQSELSRDLKLLCMKRDYLLFDNTLDQDAPLSLRVIKTQYLDEVLTKILKEDEEQILTMVTVENAHFLLGIDLHSTEYYEKFVTYVQSVILDGKTSNWYIEMSDYIIDYLYDWFEKKQIIEETKAIDRNALFAKKDEVHTYYAELEKKQLEALEHSKKKKQSPYYPDPKELQSNLKENNMFFRVGHIVEVGEGVDDEHQEALSEYRGESYVVIAVDKERETYRLATLKNYMEAESIDLCRRVGIDPGTEFYDADFKYPEKKTAEKEKKDTQNEVDVFEGIHTGLIKTYCEVCDSAWAGTLVPVKYPHYACTMCRENDSGITFGNSIEFDNAEDYGND